MKKAHLLLCCLLLIQTLSAQEPTPIRPAIIRLADSIAQIGTIAIKEYEFLSPIANQLMDSSTTEELAALTRHPHPAVRVQAFAGLLRKKEVSGELLFRIVREHWNDLDTVWFQWSPPKGRNKIGAPTGSYFLNNFSRESFSLQAGTQFRKSFQLDENTQTRLDSFLLCDPPPFDGIRMGAAFRIKPRRDCYDCVRHQVEAGSNDPAAIYLAKFQQEQDIDLIVLHLPKGTWRGLYDRLQWQPLLEFRHPRLFRVLQDSFAGNFSSGPYLRAVMQYKNRDAAALLDSAFSIVYRSKDHWNRVSTLCMELNTGFDTVYADLYIRMLTRAPENTNCRIPDPLWQCRGDTLASLYGIWKNGGRAAKERATAMFPKYHAWLQAKGEDKVVALVLEQIKPGGDYRQFQDAFEAILATKGKPYFIDPLFALLEKEPKPENRFFLAKLLLALQDPTVKPRLEKLFAEKPETRPDLLAAEKGGPIFSDFLYHFNNDKK